MEDNRLLIRYNMSNAHNSYTDDTTSEQWKPIKGWPYEVSNLGRVRRTGYAMGATAGKILKPQPIGRPRKQYPGVLLSQAGKRKTYYLHHLVAAAFLGPTPEGMEIDHKDGNRSNPNLSNLEFKTPSKNILGAVDRGHRGERRWNARLTDDLVRNIRALYDDGWTIGEIANLFHLNFTTTYHVVRKNSWKHVA